MDINDVNFNRRVHMDFHTPDFVWEHAMQRFNAKEYVKILKEANLNSLVSFVKCHHGYHYSKTDIGVRHPSLPEATDMFGEILAECHDNDIKVMAYYSIGWLTPVQKYRPEWMERGQNGEMLDTQGNPKSGPWANVCLNSPYLKEMVLPELTELINGYDIDALWLDIIECNPCHCEHCKEKYRLQFSKELPENNEELRDFVVQTKYDFISAVRDLLKSLKPEVPLTYNTSGRDKKLVELVDFNSIETHPGAPGDSDAWTRGLLTYKYLQAFKKPWESCTSRFIHGWGGWDDQPQANMTAVTSRILAHGGMINLGDQAYPDGTIDAALYKKITGVLANIKERDGYAMGHKSYKHVALLAGDFDIYGANCDNYVGAVKTLTLGHIPFDLLFSENTEDYEGYGCIVVPELESLSDDVLNALEKYAEKGGNLLIVGRYDCEEQLKDLCGFEGVEENEYSIGYMKMEKDFVQGIRESALMVPMPVYSINAKQGTKSVAEHIHPVIEPNYQDFMIFRHPRFSPPKDSTGKPAFIVNEVGEGKVAYCPSRLFSAYNRDCQWYLRDILGNVMRYIMGEGALKITAPKTVEVNMTCFGDDVYLHLINYVVQNETNHVEEVIPAYDIKVELSKALSEKITAATLLPEGNSLPIIKSEENYFIEIERLDVYSIVKLS